jgi:hypothetical protein
MRGSGRIARVFALGACVLGLFAVPGAGAGAGDLAESTSTTALAKGQPRGATAAASLNTLTITGKPVDGRIMVFLDVAGRLTITSPEGVTAPAGVTQCTQDSATQISCDPGFLGAINAQLLEGNDTFKAHPALRVVFGVPIAGRKQPLDGGPGRDRIVGAAAADHLAGGSGPDNVIGNAGGDFLEGNAGKDKLKGGAGRDFCSGGTGSDTAKNCAAAKSIP